MVAVKKGALTTVIQYFKVLSILFFTSFNNPNNFGYDTRYLRKRKGGKQSNVIIESDDDQQIPIESTIKKLE